MNEVRVATYVCAQTVRRPTSHRRACNEGHSSERSITPSDINVGEHAAVHTLAFDVLEGGSVISL
jgi:hypothetical protein